MCGITGWVDWSKDLTNETAQIYKMTNALTHRGPDDKGYWISKTVGLGHRRLTILDPEGGQQPFVINEGNRKYVMVYNGELYNFLELRDELLQKGHRFRTRGDTEVVLRAYLEWGIDAPKYFNGIFAFAIWDEAKQELVLVRDQIGVKPLFYAQKGGALIFGSEMKALLAHVDINPEITYEGLAEILTLGFRTPGNGIYKDIQEVMPGQVIQYNQQGKKETTYWKIESYAHPDDLDTTVSTIREYLYDIVNRQLIADTEVVTLVSGGLDSSGLTAIAADLYRQQNKGSLHTYSIDFYDSEQDFATDYMRPSLDTPWIEKVVQHCQTIHHKIDLTTSDLLEYAATPYRAHDLPGFGEYEVSLYLLFKAIKQRAKVAISGEAADEIFGGYPWYHEDKRLHMPTFPWIHLWIGDRQYNRFSYFSEECHRLLRPIEYLHDQYQAALNDVPTLPGEDPLSADIRKFSYLNMTHLLSMLLHRKDQMSMSVGLEVRVPFCDPRLVQYVWNIPWKMKNTDGMEKGILRRALADVLPDDVRSRKKSAYPQMKKKEYYAALQAQMQQILDDPQSPLLPFLNPEEIQREIIGQAVPSSMSAPIERLLQIDRWMKEYQVEIRP
ncbi:asparagine synthase (glutamine-hydrolysing) [Seinonella peptonophila]|uniref:asparagine synthase (glutamine-hydrolyzing) n=1 Tax=Seinonella peptonophila TaxID=112248 RepID=A0A1M4VIP5_9BACL|nr:asparagine synthase (glutamine-hydrolyzing) [Seinonella peptonophila]SHE68713.1 asparagine synthase (glutamine-hydrolysing) [Seinonella peptonophila]